MKTKLPKPREAKKYFEEKVAFSVGPSEADRLIREHQDEICIIDVRASEDYEKGHLPGAINVPEEQWERPKGLAKDKTNIVYCYSPACHLAAKACLNFASEGYPVMELDGGFETWKEAGFQVEQVTRTARQEQETPAYRH